MKNRLCRRNFIGWPSRVRTVVSQALLTPFGFLLAYQNDASRALQKVTKVTLFTISSFASKVVASSSPARTLSHAESQS